MKKLIVVCLICVFIFTSGLYKKEFDFSKIEGLQVQIFTSNNEQNAQLNGYSTVKNGEGLIIFCDYLEYLKIRKNCNNISGVTFVIEGNKNDYKKLINNLKITFLDKNECDFIGFSNKFDSCVNYKNKKVNVQGYFSDNKIYIGTPLLLGSY